MEQIKKVCRKSAFLMALVSLLIVKATAEPISDIQQGRDEARTSASDKTEAAPDSTGFEAVLHDSLVAGPEKSENARRMTNISVSIPGNGETVQIEFDTIQNTDHGDKSGGVVSAAVENSVNTNGNGGFDTVGVKNVAIEAGDHNDSIGELDTGNVISDTVHNGGIDKTIINVDAGDKKTSDTQRVSDSIGDSTGIAKIEDENVNITQEDSASGKNVPEIQDDERYSNVVFPYLVDVRINQIPMSVVSNNRYRRMSGPLNWSVGYWSDELALTPYRALLTRHDDKKWQDILAVVLRESFDLKGKSPNQVSETIEKELRDGVNIYGTFDKILWKGNWNRFDISIRTYMREALHIPADFFKIIFAGGLENGAVLDLSACRQEGYVATDIALQTNKDLKNRSLLAVANKITGNVFNFTQVNRSLGFHVLIGHSCFFAETKKALVSIAKNGYSFDLDAVTRIKTGGTGLHGFFQFDGLDKLIVGSGVGFDGGIVFQGARTILGINCEQLGYIHWKDIKEIDLRIKATGLDVEALINQGSEINYWSENNGGCKSTEKDTLTNGGDFYMVLPLKTNLIFGHTFIPFSKKPSLAVLSKYVSVYLQYTQGLAKSAGNSFTPLVLAEVENGFFRGTMPLFIGWGVGGNFGIMSSLLLGIHYENTFWKIGYEAYGTGYFYPKNGIRIMTDWQVAFGRNR